jgi:hypothetical protein
VVNPLSGFGSLSESHPYITVLQSVVPGDHAGSRLPRFFPLQRLHSHEEPHNAGGSHPAGCVAPSGFRTLSAPCSPHGLPGLFHPGPAHGVLPFEAFLRAWCRTSFRTPCPSGFLLDPCGKRPPLQGLTHHAKRIRRPGYWPGGCGVCLHGLFRFEASCPRQRRLLVAPLHPLTRFSGSAAS